MAKRLLFFAYGVASYLIFLVTFLYATPRAQLAQMLAAFLGVALAATVWITRGLWTLPPA